MIRWLLHTAILALSTASASAQETLKITERPDWASFFDSADASGTIVIIDERKNPETALVFDNNRAETPFTPASTFKIPHALFALDAGIIEDEFQKIPWDGVKRSYPAWNADQDLRSSMRHSAVWVYEEFANKIGIEQEREYLEKTNYGNADPSGAAPFWIDGNLLISAHQQVAFLRNLYRNKLPFPLADQRLVKDIMINEAGKDWIIRAKTGWSGTLGWWVGWVERPDGAVFFALNIDTPNRTQDLPKREGIVRNILSSFEGLEMLPEQTE